MPQGRDMTEDELRAVRARADFAMREAAAAVAMTRTAVAQTRALIEAAKRSKGSDGAARRRTAAARPAEVA